MRDKCCIRGHYGTNLLFKLKMVIIAVLFLLTGSRSGHNLCQVFPLRRLAIHRSLKPENAFRWRELHFMDQLGGRGMGHYKSSGLFKKEKLDTNGCERASKRGVEWDCMRGHKIIVSTCVPQRNIEIV